jgi:hypothetical protein
MKMDDSIPQWVRQLALEDWQFIKRFILASGSLKDLAGQYGISYPTVRIRLDRLIGKVRALEDGQPKSSFHQAVSVMVAEGRLDTATARSLIKEFEACQNGKE